MSRRIVLKSSIAVVLLGFVLVFSSCKKKEEPKPQPTPSQNEIVGVWKYQKTELKEFSTTADPSTEAMLKMFLQQQMSGDSGGKVEFTKDGKVIFRDGSGEEEESGTYEIKGNKLTITTEGGIETYDYSISGKTMYWKANMDAETLAYLSMAMSMFFEEEIAITKCVMQVTLVKQ
jgi:hypothetical protein